MTNKLSLELARKIINQIAELQSSIVEGVNLDTINLDDGFVHSIADEIDEYYSKRKYDATYK